MPRATGQQPYIPFRLDELARLAAELGCPARRIEANRLDVQLAPGMVLAFCNLVDESTTLVGFEGTPWHSHDVVQFLTGPDSYIECDEIDRRPGAGRGAARAALERAAGVTRVSGGGRARSNGRAAARA